MALGVALGALYLPVALAAQGTISKTIFERSLQNEDISAHFDVNRDLGRAWVEVDLTQDLPGSYIVTHEPEVFPRAVDGLYYDQASKQVIYRNGTNRVVCAEDSTVLWGKSLKETGQCPLSVTSETRHVDDGFNGHEETVGKVVLELPASSAPSVSSK
jgi:hypothetical protein